MNKYLFLVALVATFISAPVALAAGSITIVEPAPNTVWQTAGRHTVMWSSEEAAAGHLMSIHLKRADGTVIPLATQTVNDGVQIVSLPRSATPGAYDLVLALDAVKSQVPVTIQAKSWTAAEMQTANALTALQDFFDRLSKGWKR